MLEPVEGELCLPEVIRCVILCMLEAMEGRIYLLEVPEVMGCVLGRYGVLCTLEAVEGTIL